MIVSLEAQGTNAYNCYALCLSVKVPEFDKHLKKARGHIGQNVVEITIKMKTIVQKTLMIKYYWFSSSKLIHSYDAASVHFTEPESVDFIA